jgi:hypothetical protein
MHHKLALITLTILISLILIPRIPTKPKIVWFVVWKNIEEDFIQKATRYKPDFVILTIFAESDLVPPNESKFDLREFVEKMHELGIKVYFGFSLFSHSAYDDLKEEFGLEFARQKLANPKELHIAEFARSLKRRNPERYEEFFSIYLEKGLIPEEIPNPKRKPVKGYYLPPGTFTSICPLYTQFQRFLREMIEEAISIAKPDGLAFDHIRFFTFDQCFCERCKKFMLSKGLNLDDYTPKPIFVLEREGWREEDKIFYQGKSEIVILAIENVTSEFSLERWGTTMGVTRPARSVGQYVELQARVFDSLLLMAYDEDPREVFRNVRETVELSGAPVVLGIHSNFSYSIAMRNAEVGLLAGASGIYLLGYKFDDRTLEGISNLRRFSSRLFIPLRNPMFIFQS